MSKLICLPMFSRSFSNAASFALILFPLFPFAARVDKQQDFDLPSLRMDENDVAQINAQKNRSRSPRFGPPMSQISGVTRPLLSHTNSFTGERLPTFGVETPHENALGTLLGDIDTWGIDIFKISELSSLRPLTSIAYTVFQVSFFRLRNRRQYNNKKTTTTNCRLTTIIIKSFPNFH